ncbi:hypothetical protein K5X85_29205 [Streptomyces sp. A144]|uniref:hypothetical protein n=1 Tax=Streptomyces sp. A144 TaxID=2871487 RepID=UPI001CC060DB|nr:hypothetical protein [Streptomyces sp. A144]UAX56808.1 hypothetical protein K5X85_29205 [Streptomyces sp. A144]
MASRIPEVIAALVALGKADSAEPGSVLAGVEIADGPEASDTQAQEWLIVGFDGDPSGDFEAAQSVGGWSDLRSGREEQFQVLVAVVVNRGDQDVVAARARTYEIAQRVEAWLRADPSIGLRSLEAGVEATRLIQEQTETGATARLLLTVAGRAFT